jgi:hypothetical protein
MSVPPIIIHGTPEEITITLGSEQLKINPSQGKFSQVVVTNESDPDKKFETGPLTGWKVTIK